MKILKTYNQLFETVKEFYVGDIIIHNKESDVSSISLIYYKDSENFTGIFYDILPIGIDVFNGFISSKSLYPSKSESFLGEDINLITDTTWKEIINTFEQNQNRIKRIKKITKIDITQLPKYIKIKEQIDLENNINKFNI